MDKGILREKMKHQMSQVSKKNRRAIEQSFVAQLQMYPPFQKAQTIGITLSHGFEWNTQPIVLLCQKLGKTVCVPKINRATKTMQFVEITSDTPFEKKAFGINEPISDIYVAKNEIDVLIVPGLAFSTEGYRIGFGGGYYDRYLKDFHQETVALAADFQVVDSLPIEPHDIPVSKLLIANV